MDELMSNGEFSSFIEAINSIKELKEEELTDEIVERSKEEIDNIFNDAVISQTINSIIQNLERQNLTRQETFDAVNSLKNVINELVYGEDIVTGNKKAILDLTVNKIHEIFNNVIDRYHNYSIELPMTLDEDAQVPSYAHDSDAAADMYATEDIMIPAHFHGVPVGTGVHIQLPEGWVAMLFPRSSIGAKTPLRLSNSVGIIDSGYRGEIRALYDNIGDEPYQIHKGDRIAQLMVMPSYRFKAQVVDTLENSDRGEGGFGSTGT